MSYKVLLRDPLPPKSLQLFYDQVPAGWELRVPKTSEEDEAVELARDVDFIAVIFHKVTPRIVEAAKRVRLIQKHGIGTDCIDVAAAAQAGIPVACTRGANAIPVAEFTIFLMMAVQRKLPVYGQILESGKWQGRWDLRLECHELFGKTLGLVGLGCVGREVARRARGFGVEILYYDIVPAPAEVEAELGVTPVPFDQLLRRSDIVSLHATLTPESRHMINAETLALMKPSAILINSARGELVDEPALVAALQSGQIAGAGVDVFEREPADPANPLLHLPNAIAFPHVAAGTEETSVRVVRRVFENFQRVAAGQPLPEADVVLPASEQWAVSSGQ